MSTRSAHSTFASSILPFSLSIRIASRCLSFLPSLSLSLSLFLSRFLAFLFSPIHSIPLHLPTFFCFISLHVPLRTPPSSPQKIQKIETEKTGEKKKEGRKTERKEKKRNNQQTRTVRWQFLCLPTHLSNLFVPLQLSDCISDFYHQCTRSPTCYPIAILPLPIRPLFAILYLLNLIDHICVFPT